MGSLERGIQEISRDDEYAGALRQVSVQKVRFRANTIQYAWIKGLKMGHQIIWGSSVLTNTVPEIKNALIKFPGQAIDGTYGFEINEDIMSRHILLLGGSGCGKTNAFCYTVEALRSQMTDDDVAIIFDTKGEFFDWFSKTGDYVIGNSARFRSISYTWNIFDEILADGDDEVSISMNARELAFALFHDRGSSAQPFFCNAAKDIFRGIILHFIRQAKMNPADWNKKIEQ